MTRRRTAALAALLFAAVLAVALASGAAWIFHTPSGLAWLTAQLAGYVGEDLTLEGVSGTLAGGARIDAIQYTGKDIEVRVRDAELALSALSFIKLRPRISVLRAAEVAVVPKPTEPRGRPPDTLELPGNFEVADARVARLVIDMGKGPVELTNLRFAYAGGKSKHTVRDLTVSGFGHTLTLNGTIDAQPPFAIDAATTAAGTEPAYAARATLKGNLTEIAVEGAATSGAGRIEGAASLRPYDALPLGSARVRATDVDLSALQQTWPRTALTAELALDRKGDLLTGPVHLENTLPGPYDKNRLPLQTLRADLSAHMSVVGFTSLHADLGHAGSIAGSGTVNRDGAALTLKARHLDLQALYTRLRDTRLAGTAEIQLAAKRQTVTADLRENDFALSLTASRRGDLVEIPRFRATARGGVVTGNGRLTLTAPRPFSAAASFSRFDPAGWGDFAAGSINGTASAKGTLSGPSAEVEIAIRDSRWLDAPLTARGRASLTAERLQRVELETTLGGNRLSAQGALGAAGDTLAVRFDAPRLGLIDRQLQGTLRGSAHLTGAWRTPRVRFDMTGTELAHKAYGRVKAFDANGTVSLQGEGAMDVHAVLRGISSEEWQVSSARLDLDGTRSAHTALVQATGDRVDFRARAQGEFRADAGWSGTLRELVNRGDVPVELKAPVSLTVSRVRTRVDPFELHVSGGELAVSELVYDQGRLSTSGRLANLPLQPILALTGNRAGISATLRLSGSWSLKSAPQWLGAISVRRESGDLVVGAERKIRLGLETIALDAKLGERATVFNARIVSALASVEAQGRVRPVGSGAAARYGRFSPVEFTAALDIARLAPLAEFAETPMLVEGEARARLEGRGTLADPQITGPVTARRLAVALPVEGINLTDGTLDAELTAQEIRVKSFSIRGGEGVLTAEGTLARKAFNEASVDWRADRFTALARPDRRLVVSGRGNAGLKGGRLSLTGNLNANEGEFQIGTASLPQLGDDVVVVGRERKVAQTEAKQLKALSLDLNIALGNRVHVLGHGLDVWLSGDVRVYTSARGDILAKGTVNARNGTFVAYGQRLEIDRGYLYFNGPAADPALDIVALRKRLAVEAGVAVTGTLRNPLVRVVSNPPLPQGEALSWLMLGRPPSQAGAGELSALPLATSALAGKATGSIARRLKLDEVGLREGGTASQQFLTLGKRITDRIYVGFEQSIGAFENLLRIEMTLTERIVLRAQAGETSLFGVFYRYRWD